MNQNPGYMRAEGYALIGAAFEVHREQGGGLSEEIYQESFELELGFRTIPHISKKELRVFYKGHSLSKTYIPDLFIHGKIVTELKACRSLNREHERQLLNYMRITRKALGYLINFGPIDDLEWKRFILSEFIPR